MESWVKTKICIGRTTVQNIQMCQKIYLFFTEHLRSELRPMYNKFSCTTPWGQYFMNDSSEEVPCTPDLAREQFRIMSSVLSVYISKSGEKYYIQVMYNRYLILLSRPDNKNPEITYLHISRPNHFFFIDS